jgi:hypothetical protein
MMYYDFARLHRTLRVTPAMAAGVTDRLWEIGDIVALAEKPSRGFLPPAGPTRSRPSGCCSRSGE